MKIVSRMIFAQIMKNSLFVLLTLVALFAFFDLIGQSGNIGTSYSMGQAFLLTALILPTRCYEVLPIAVMLGSFLRSRGSLQRVSLRSFASPASDRGDSAACSLCRVSSL